MKSRKQLAAILFATCLNGAVALAQTAPAEPGDSSGSSGSSGSHRGAAASGDPQAKPMNNNGAAQIGLLLGRNGGSLLRASLAAPTDPGQAKLSQISFAAVAEPEPKTLKKHDLVTIIINEASAATSKAQNTLQKNAEFQAEINQMIQLKLSKGSIYGLPTPTAVPGVDFTGLRTFNGQGDNERTDTLTARITAEVLDVKPNGTVVVQARKHIKTDDEEQQFILSGICRAEDVGADNTILSSQLYDLSLQKNSKGDVRQSTERGNLPKLLDFLNPF